jgi:hypothetical protein
VPAKVVSPSPVPSLCLRKKAPVATAQGQLFENWDDAMHQGSSIPAKRIRYLRMLNEATSGE